MIYFQESSFEFSANPAANIYFHLAAAGWVVTGPACPPSCGALKTVTDREESDALWRDSCWLHGLTEPSDYHHHFVLVLQPQLRCDDLCFIFMKLSTICSSLSHVLIFFLLSDAWCVFFVLRMLLVFLLCSVINVPVQPPFGLCLMETIE